MLRKGRAFPGNSASHIRRDANELRESLPVAWMWAVPAGADVCGVRV